MNTSVTDHNAAHRIHGYYIPRPNESAEAAFVRAKYETIANLTAALNQTKRLSFGEFQQIRKQGFFNFGD